MLGLMLDTHWCADWPALLPLVCLFQSLASLSADAQDSLRFSIGVCLAKEQRRDCKVLAASAGPVRFLSPSFPWKILQISASTTSLSGVDLETASSTTWLIDCTKERDVSLSLMLS